MSYYSPLVALDIASRTSFGRASALNEMSDSQLRDIGIERDRIESLVESLVRRAGKVLTAG